MKAEKLPVVWCQRPDEEDDSIPDSPYIGFYVARPAFYAIDADQFILPVNVVERNGENYEKPRLALLKQYGGAEVAMEVLTAGPQGIEPGQYYLIEYDEMRGFTAEFVDRDEDDSDDQLDDD